MEATLNQTVFDIPEYCNGIDIETKSTEVNAFVLAIGGVTFSTRTLGVVNTLNLTIDPECEIQTKYLQRHTSDSTMKWWFPQTPDNFSPTALAQQWTWSGTMDTETACQMLDKYLAELKKMNAVYSMRGPEFDYVILNSLYKDMGNRLNVRFSNLESHRTVERGLIALGVDPTLSEKEIEHISPSDNYVEHVAVCDAGKEAYQTACYYHLLWRIRNEGYEKAMEVAKNWKLGIYEAIPNE